MVDLKDFKKNKDFLICVDSDGCAMDTMDIKHFKCFGPCMVKEWKLEQWQEEILTRWNEINLYSMTRGINRFLGLAMALSEINEKYCAICGIDGFVDWTKHSKELSNGAIKKMMTETENPIFSKALLWSLEVNKGIEELDDAEKRPFAGAKEGLQAAHLQADIAVVSSANKEAVIDEWERYKLTNYVDVLCCQDAGTKAHCIETLKALGYEDGHVLMIGDAVGDKEAAEKNGVYYYPILVKKEQESWDEFRNIGLEKFIHKDFAEYEKQKQQEFFKNLGED